MPFFLVSDPSTHTCVSDNLALIPSASLPQYRPHLTSRNTRSLLAPTTSLVLLDILVPLSIVLVPLSVVLVPRVIHLDHRRIEARR